MSYFVLSAVLVLGVVSCKPQTTQDGDVMATASAAPYMSVGDFLAPAIGAWTGRLILSSDRKPDGGAWLEVYSTPKGVTAPGPRVWLTLDKNDADVKEYLNRTVTKIDFSIAGDRIAKAEAGGLFLPRRLDGWSSVNPIESLAGARPLTSKEIVNWTPTADSVEVLVRNASLRGGVLYTKSEPVQITGREVALIKFVAPDTGNKYKVVHYGVTGGNEFAGLAETLALTVSTLTNPNKPPVSSFKDIEKSMLNSAGWYAFGERVDGVFQVRALEPRALMAIAPAHPEANGEDFVRNRNFASEKDRKGKGYTAVIQKDGKYELREGDRGLVMHLFGGIGGKNGDKGPVLPISKRQLYTGHFAFGIGSVVTDPFTKKLKMDIEYKQVYANNDGAIVSGSSKYHTYSGSLERGWMYTRPQSDVFIKHPAFSEPYDFGNGVNFSPLDGISRELEIMMARFRTGDGSGIAEVTLTNSCVQDSNQAMYIAIMKGLDWAKNNSTVQALATSEPQNASIVRLRALENIMNDYKSSILGRASIREDWREGVNASLAIKKEYAGGLASFISAVESRTVLVPRWAYDDIAVLLHKHGALQWFMRTDQVGGFIPDIYPMAPGLDK